MRKLVMFTIVFAMTLATSMNAQEKAKKLKLYGDVRFRTELDRDSKKNNGDMRADRDRIRYRFRFGFKYQLNENFDFGGRIRSGNPMNQQSPHVTFGKEFHSDAFSIDKVYINYKSGGFNMWVGKNSLPIWEPNELLWDGDVNPEGVAMAYKMKLGDNAKMRLSGGYFIVQNFYSADGKKQTFGQHANISMAQAKFCTKISDNKLTLAAGMLKAYKLPNKPDGNMTDVMNYTILPFNLQFSMKNGFALGADYIMNMEDYKGKVDANYEDQKTGMDFYAKYKINDKWSVKATYASIQKYAVIDYYAQDDWVRWGNSNMTRSSNFAGFGVALKYNIAKHFNTQLKFWNVKGIAKPTGASALETGTRIRWDFNIKF